MFLRPFFVDDGKAGGVSHQIHINLNGDFLIGGVGVGNADLGQVGEVWLGIVFFLTKLPDQVFGMGQGGIWL